MAYLITSADGDITIQEEERDLTTSLVLVGRHYSNWGESYAQNFVDLLTNFASAEPERPTDARRGQLWYDTNVKALSVFRGTDGWYRLGSTADQWSQPLTLSLSGDATGSVSFDGNEGTVTLNASLANVNPNPGTYTSPAFTVDAKGRITSVSNNGGDGVGIAAAVESVNFANPSNALLTEMIGDVVIRKAQIVHALGFEPYPASNPANYAPSSTPQDLSSFLLLNGSRAMTGGLNMGNNEITGLSAPQTPASAVRKQDLDALAQVKTLRKFQGGNDLEYNVTVSTAAPSGGVDGDVWYRY